MSTTWSLKELYTSFDSVEFTNDMKKFEQLIGELNALVTKITANHEDEQSKLEQVIEKYEEVYNIGIRLQVFVSLTLSTNSKDEKAMKLSDQIEKIESESAASDAVFKKWVGEIENISEVINASEILPTYEFYLSEIVESAKYSLSDKEEILLAKLKNTGSSSWQNYKNLIVSMHKVEVEIEGEKKEMPLTALLNLSDDKRAEVRKAAYHAEIESYKKIEDGIAAALNGIKGEVLTEAEMRGYNSVLEMTLKNSRMDQKTLEVMLEAMEEYLPHFRGYLKRKAEMLGHTNGLPFYDMYAPVVDANMEMSYEDGKVFVEKNFRAFSQGLGDYAKKAFDNNWIDVYPKEGKRGGAFCCNIRPIKESRILLNHGDSLGDVITLAHELGHGFHGQCLEGEKLLNTSYPMPLAETASNFCETIVKKAAIKEASDKDAFAILETEISDSTQVIVDIYSRYLFESEVIEKRKEGSLSVKEIKEAMTNAQEKAYGDGLDPEYLHPYMWTWKPHYYSPARNFYNFPYAFGLLFAKGLYAEYLERGEDFVKEYEQLLAATGKNSIADVAKIMNIDVNDKNFWRKSLEVIKEDIDLFIALSKSEFK